MGKGEEGEGGLVPRSWGYTPVDRIIVCDRSSTFVYLRSRSDRRRSCRQNAAVPRRPAVTDSCRGRPACSEVHWRR